METAARVSRGGRSTRGKWVNPRATAYWTWFLTWRTRSISSRRCSKSVPAGRQQGGHPVPDTVGHFVLAHERQGIDPALAVDDRDLVGRRPEGRARRADLIGHDQVQVLGLELGRGVFDQVLRLRGKADQDFVALGAPDFSQNVRIAGQADRRSGRRLS